MSIASLPRTGKTGRRLFHMAGGSFFPLLALFLPRPTLLALLAGATALALLVEGVRLRYAPLQRLIGRLVAVKEKEATGISAASYLLLGALAAFLIFPVEIAVAAVLFAAVADPVASVVGEHWGRRRVGAKSVEGSLAFLAAALVVGLVLAGTGRGPGVVVAAAGGLAAATAELLPLPVDDNLAVPLLSGGIMTLVAWQSV
jgi:glycerol-3-phosphate acyltransferase PlsY